MTTELLHMDCMEYMKGLDDNAFDLAIVDPPYGIGIDGQAETVNKNRNPKQNRKKHNKKGWDNNIPPAEYFIELKRVSNNQIIWGANYFVEHLQQGTKGWVFWYKGQQGLTMSDGELAFTSFDKATRMVTLNRVEILMDGSIHPTQKPVKLYRYLLDNYAEKGERILDTHLGSGSSAIAAHYFGCEFVGIELDEDYYKAACKRFDQMTRQEMLF